MQELDSCRGYVHHDGRNTNLLQLSTNEAQIFLSRKEVLVVCMLSLFVDRTRRRQTGFIEYASKAMSSRPNSINYN